MVCELSGDRLVPPTGDDDLPTFREFDPQQEGDPALTSTSYVARRLAARIGLPTASIPPTIPVTGQHAVLRSRIGIRLPATALPIEQDFFAPIEIDGKPIDTMRRAWYPYTLPFNMTGNPAVSIPCGWDSEGLPVGLQLIGRLGEDALLLRATALFEQARPWAQRRPPLPELA